MKGSFRPLCVVFCLTCMIAGALSSINPSKMVFADYHFATVIIKNAKGFGSVMMAGEPSGCISLINLKGAFVDSSTIKLSVIPFETVYPVLYTGGSNLSNMCTGPGKGTMPAKVKVGAAGTTTILTVDEGKTIPAMSTSRPEFGGSTAGWAAVMIKNASRFGSVMLAGKSSGCLRLIGGQDLSGSTATICGLIPHQAIYPILYTGDWCTGSGKGTIPAKIVVGAGRTTTILTVKDNKLDPGANGGVVVAMLTVKDKSR